ncbi:MAG: Xylanase [Planctomycetaceae bacterium]|nr:Xylanase [Planctomycetaceae bacterium]
MFDHIFQGIPMELKRSRLRFVSLACSLLSCGFFLTLAQSAEGREPDVVLNLWPGPPPGEAIKAGPEQDFTKPTDRLIAGRRIIKLGNVAIPQAHVFLPPKDKRNGTSIVICPGGGFSILAWDLEGTEVAEWLNTLGVTGIVVKYRVPTRDRTPVWLAPVQDAQRAISIARSRAAEWGLTTDRVGILGFSAGGATAAHAAIKNGERAYPAADEIDKSGCRPDFAALIYPGGIVDDKTGQVHPDIIVSKETPPMFFAHAQDDGVRVENSVLLFLALKKAGVPSELHVYDVGGHGYGMREVPEFPVTTWNVRCGEWLKRRGLLAPVPKTP